MYLQVLELDPRHSDALFLLGVLERQAGRLEEAHRRLSEAARWAADRAPIEAELRVVEQVGHRRNCTPAQAYRQTDCSALPMMAHA
jgi:predicted TPR repeat methyltransferase